MSWLLGAVWLFSGALLLPSCETTDPGAGSNTNWLRSCESDGECGEGLSCTCGVCSRVCEDDCSLLPDAECAPLGSARLRTQCGDAEAPSGLCLPVCVDSASCAPGQLCVDGGCVAPGCDRPPSWCEAHHGGALFAEGGRTNLAEGFLLCSAHHHEAHRHRWRFQRAPEGRAEVDRGQGWERNHRYRP